MAQQVQELIDKIKIEGIQEAEKKARDIEDEARKKAENIGEDARKKADHIILQAKEQSRKIHESTEAALRQASRDAILSLKIEIRNILDKIIHQKVNESLSPEKTGEILAEVIRASVDKSADPGDIRVYVSEDDARAIEDSLMKELSEELKKGVKVVPSEEFGGGFQISFDGGKSSFNFSDESLADYLSVFLNERVSSLLQHSVV